MHARHRAPATHETPSSGCHSRHARPSNPACASRLSILLPCAAVRQHVQQLPREQLSEGMHRSGCDRAGAGPRLARQQLAGQSECRLRMLYEWRPSAHVMSQKVTSGCAKLTESTTRIHGEGSHAPGCSRGAERWPLAALTNCATLAYHLANMSWQQTQSCGSSQMNTSAHRQLLACLGMAAQEPACCVHAGHCSREARASPVRSNRSAPRSRWPGWSRLHAFFRSGSAA